MESSKEAQCWDDHADNVVAVAYEFVSQCDNLTSERLGDPKVVALTLLSRSLCHFKSVFLLLDAGLVVDARTLTRCIFEDLFWQGRLAERGAEFVKEARADHAKSRQSRGNWVLEWIGAQGEIQPYAEGLQEQMDQLRCEFPKRQSIKFADIAKGTLGGAYLWYRQLSADAAHPSLESLSRHLSKEPDGAHLISVEPTPKKAEVDATKEYACQALIGLIVGASQIVGPTEAGKRLSGLFDEFIRLAGGKPNSGESVAS
jgi:hypothetical protein